MLDDTRIERFARAIGRRLTTPPAHDVREQHLRDITHAIAADSRPAGNVRRLNSFTHGFPRSRRIVPAFAAVLLLVVLVATPMIRNAGNDLPLLSAAAVGGPQQALGNDVAMERGAEDSAPDIMWFAERYVFVLADGLDVAEGTQPAWKLEVDGSLTQRAETLRALFGLPSVAPSEWDPTVLIAGDPEGVSVTLYPTGEWYYANYSAYPQWSCPDVDGQAAPGFGGQVEPYEGERDASESGEISEPSEGREPYECTPPPAAENLPSSADARRQATALFAQLGITNLTFETPYRDEWTVSLWATQRFDELADYDGQGASVTFGADGQILGAYGTFARPTLIGDYPTVSAMDAVTRLNAQFDDNGPGGGPRPLPAIDGGDMPVSDRESSEAGETVTREVMLVAVTIVPAPIWSADGFTVIAPHYRFTDSDGQHWWVAAVTDRYLAG